MHKKRGFTLIELMIVITIISIISLATYMPYAHHQKKTLIKQAAREISQSLSDARNLAINGLSTASGANLNVGIYFDSDATQIDYYAGTGSLNSSHLYRSKKLPRGIQVDAIGGSNSGALISFSAIHGMGKISGAAFSGEILIDISYKGANSAVLQKQITYYTQSFISDY